MENIKLFCVSLGCDKNLVDTEKMLGLLKRTGHHVYGQRRDRGGCDTGPIPAALSEMPRRGKCQPHPGHGPV